MIVVINMDSFSITVYICIFTFLQSNSTVNRVTSGKSCKPKALGSLLRIFKKPVRALSYEVSGHEYRSRRISEGSKNTNF
jgi:hypothetical protein